MIQRPAPALATAIPANAMVIAVNRITIATRRMVRQARGYTSPREPRGVAQLVEHRSPKPGVAGSSPVAPVPACKPKPACSRVSASRASAQSEARDRRGLRSARLPTRGSYLVLFGLAERGDALPERVRLRPVLACEVGRIRLQRCLA